MTTTSANIAGVMQPFGGLLRRQVPGKVYDIDEITPTGTKKKRKKNGVYELVSIDGRVVLEARQERKSLVNGKSGVWRRYRGRNHFFPYDKSGPIPPIGTTTGV
ncbi:MAG: hypothetical protein JW704_11890 [Anaerolineaceae bacterium]|nr:hypothetical protein [Anaerolineaceae bacterium]